VLCGWFVGAVLGVETGVRKTQAFDGAIVNEMLSNDLLDVAGVYVPVPDSLGVDDDDGAMLALIEATGLVRADMVLQAGFLDGVLEGRLELLTALRETAWAGGEVIALVGADEDVVVEFWQLAVPC
jgi:hypothetical protein